MKTNSTLDELKRRVQYEDELMFTRNSRILFPKKCLDCGRTFKSEAGLTKHANMIHLTLSPNQMKQKEAWRRKHEQ